MRTLWHADPFGSNNSVELRTFPSSSLRDPFADPAAKDTSAPLIELNGARASSQRQAKPAEKTIMDQDEPRHEVPTPVIAPNSATRLLDTDGSIRESGIFSPAAPSTAASRHFAIRDSNSTALDSAYTDLRASQHKSTGPAGREANSLLLPPGSEAGSASPRLRPDSGLSQLSGSSISLDDTATDSATQPQSARRVQMMNGGKAEVVQALGSSKSVRSKRFPRSGALAMARANRETTTMIQ